VARGLVVSALFFFPRGGSAQVVRSLARALPAAGWRLTLAAGSLGRWGEPTHAASFFAGLDVHALDYSPALARAEPLVAPVPFPPSYEDRPGAPIASLPPSTMRVMSGSSLPGSICSRAPVPAAPTCSICTT
jgi:hypothetical protein